MRLITHNMLKCNVRGVIEGYPLIIEPETIQIDEASEDTFDKDKLRIILKKVNWTAFKASVASLR